MGSLLTKQTDRRFRTEYFLARNKRLQYTFAPAIGTRIETDQEQEEYTFLGESPYLREWKSSRMASDLLEQGVTIKNVDYEATLKIKASDLRRRKSDQIIKRVRNLGTRSALHWDQLIVDTLTSNSGAGPVGYDGVAFFAATHSEGSSGTQKNLLTATEVPALDVGTAAAPTATEMQAAILGVIQHMLGFKDDRGQPMTDGCREFSVVAPVNLWGALVSALGLKVIQGSGGAIDNPLANLEGFTIRPHVTGLLTTTTVFYVFATDVDVRSLILQDEVDDAIETDESRVFTDKMVYFGVSATRGIGPGYWQFASKATLS